jgi:predicted outer membrane repeat protein
LHFVENTAWQGGGLYARISHSRIGNCTFARNHALRIGGAIMDKTSILFTERCGFIGNTAANNGGAVYYAGSSSLARGCTFLQNESGAGGAIFGITLVDFSGTIIPASPTIVSCLFVANQATGSGGALFSSGVASRPVVRNSSFVGNRGGAIGTAIYVQVSDIVVRDSIFWWNGDSPTATLGLWFPPCGLYVDRCIVEGGPSSLFADDGCTVNWGEHNVEADPEFIRMPDDGGDGWGDNTATPDTDEGANDDFGNLRLMLTSPAINTGDPAFVPAVDETDPDGFPRVLLGRLDLGAFEFGPFAWAECLGGPDAVHDPDTCHVLDVDGDADVDLEDLAEFEAMLGN